MERSHLWAAITAWLLTASPITTAVHGQGTWATTLQPRNLDGNFCSIEAFYDTVLDITWLKDAGKHMTASDAVSWVSALDFGPGIDNWRLPKLTPIDGSSDFNQELSYIGNRDYGYNISAPGTAYAGSPASEIAHLFYNTLGNAGRCNAASSTFDNCVENPEGTWFTNKGPFSNLTEYDHWTGTGLGPNAVFTFWTRVGGQLWDINYHQYIKKNILAVHPGDVGGDPADAKKTIYCRLFRHGVPVLIPIWEDETVWPFLYPNRKELIDALEKAFLMDPDLADAVRLDQVSAAPEHPDRFTIVLPKNDAEAIQWVSRHRNKVYRRTEPLVLLLADNDRNRKLLGELAKNKRWGAP